MTLRVGIIFGGKSAEHEVSIQSAVSIHGALDRTKYTPLLLGVDKAGIWHLGGEGFILNADDPKSIAMDPSAPAVVPVERPGEATVLVSPETGEVLSRVDVFFPIIHGTFGEDGCLQGMLRLLDAPFVGAGVLGSAVGMDKDVMKRLLVEAGIPVPPFRVIRRNEFGRTDFLRMAEALGLPLFVKPCNMGSSIGIRKVLAAEKLGAAVGEALSFDHKAIVESAVEGREIECAVLGNDNPSVSRCGEIIPTRDFYSYEAKYIDEDGAKLVAPAELESSVQAGLQAMALKVFRVMECSGLARVDFFLTPEGSILVNEINTLPGFTRISMYPRLWDLSGVPYPLLLDKLIDLALERHSAEAGLRRTWTII